MKKVLTFRTVLTALTLTVCLLPLASCADTNKAPVVTVKPVLGVPIFVVDDAPFVTPCFETYSPQFKFFDQFAKANTKLYSFNINAGGHSYNDGEKCWVDPNTWNFSVFVPRFEAVLKADPDAMIIPRIYIGLPLWWAKANPDECQVLDHGARIYKEPNRNGSVPKDRPFPVLVSEKWREDMEMSLRKTLQWLHNSKYGKHIFGYLIAGTDTEEWYHWSSGSDQLAGYSKPMQKGFQQWLKKKYVTAENLQKSWNRDDVDFDTVVVPSREERYDLGKGTFRDPAKKMNVIDFYTFYNDMVPETIDHFAKIIKDETDNRVVTGAFYGFMYAFRGDPEYGHNALGTYLKSDNLDFVFVTASYMQRNFATGGTWQRSPAMSTMLNGKVYYHDCDTMSFVSKEHCRSLGWNEATFKECFRYHSETTDTAQQSRWVYQRDTGYALCNGFYQSWFDLHGGHYNHPELMDEIGKLNKMWDVAKRYDRSSNSQILVVSDELSCSYATFRSALLETAINKPQWKFMQLGAQLDHVLINDLAQLDTEPYKLVIFLNTYNMSDKQRMLVNKRLLNKNRHIVWCYAPGYFNHNKTDAAFMKTLTGINIVPSDDESFIVPKILLVDTDGYAKSLAKAGKKIGTNQKTCKLFYVDDPMATILGTFPGTNKVTLAKKRLKDWTSIYTITSDLPPTAWREIARAAGVHIFNEKDDTFYANKTFVTLHANGAGKRTVKFPGACDIYDMAKKESVAVNTDTYTRDYQNGETVILRWKTRL